jgi:hypothetical protein
MTGLAAAFRDRIYGSTLARLHKSLVLPGGTRLKRRKVYAKGWQL